MNVTTTTYFNLPYFNECIPIETLYPDLVDNTILRLSFGLLYASVWILGLTGNAIILYLILSPNNSISFTVRTVFIGSFACSDVIIGIISLPVTAVIIFTRAWPFTTFMCRTVGFFQANRRNFQYKNDETKRSFSTKISRYVTLESSINCKSIVQKSLDPYTWPVAFIKLCRQHIHIKFYANIDRRFQLILYSTTNTITYSRARINIAIIWVLGYCIASPLAMFVEVIEYPGLCGSFCEERWPASSPVTRKLYGLIVLCLQFGLPVLISCYCYMRISHRLADQIRHRRKQAILPEAERRLTARRRRTNRMMATIVGLFVAAWLPLNAVNLVRDFEWDHLVPPYAYNLLFALCHLVAMTSLVWNPVVYGLYNEAFRKAVMSIVRTALGRQHDYVAKSKNGRAS